MKKIFLGGVLGKGKFALVDDEDYERVNKLNWSFSSRQYAQSKLNKKTISMHRFVFCPLKDQRLDHKNGDKLDNRKENLRVADMYENARNRGKNKGIYSSIYKGVCWSIRDKRWRAQIKIKSKKIGLGNFKSELHAAMSYDIWAREIHGEFAYPNFPTALYK